MFKRIPNTPLILKVITEETRKMYKTCSKESGTEVYSEPSETSKMEFFAKIVNG